MKTVSIAALIKAQEDANKKSRKTTDSSRVVTLERRIQDLEASLKKEDDESGTSSGDDDSDEEKLEYAHDKQTIVDKMRESDLIVQSDGSGKVVKYLSLLSEERIEPLKKQYLPAPDCGSSKNKRHKESTISTNAKRKRIVQFSDEIGDRLKSQGKSTESHAATPRKNTERTDSGMEKTIKELLKNYQPSSVNRLPFWCRVCKFQGKDTQDLIAHRESEFHKAAVKIEMKMSHCQLCKKQFTSPIQLQEHIGAKAHKERLEKVRSANKRNAKFK